MLNQFVTVSEILTLLVDRADVEHHYNERVSNAVPTAADIASWTAETGLDPSTLLNELGLSLARAYDRGALSYTACDFIANDLISCIRLQADADHTLQVDDLWDVYDAFDEGEYFHNNNRAEDPEETYTRPLIKAFLSRVEKSEQGNAP